MRAISRENRKHYLSNVLAQSDLLPTVRREVEHEDGEEADAHAGDDEVDGVEEGLPPHGDVEGDVQVGLVTARVELHVPDDKMVNLKCILCLFSYVNKVKRSGSPDGNREFVFICGNVLND